MLKVVMKFVIIFSIIIIAGGFLFKWLHDSGPFIKF